MQSLRTNATVFESCLEKLYATEQRLHTLHLKRTGVLLSCWVFRVLRSPYFTVSRRGAGEKVVTLGLLNELEC